MKPTVFFYIILILGIFSTSLNKGTADANNNMIALDTNMVSTNMVEQKADLARVYLYKFSRIKKELKFSAKRRVTKLT